MIRPATTPLHNAHERDHAAMAPVLFDRALAIEEVLKKQIFFVVGSPKSGTTWVQHLLDAHPQIACRGETHFAPFLQPIEQLVNSYNQQKRGKHMPALDDHDTIYVYAQMFALILSKWGNEDGVTCVGEKSPPHAGFAEILANVFQHARFIHIVRDPRDVTVSGWYHNLRKGANDFHAKFPTLTDYSRFIAEAIWPTSVNGARKVRELDPERYLEVRYEDLLAEPENLVTSMLRFLDVEDAPEHVQHCISESSFERMSNGRARGEEDLGSFYRKGVAGDWKNHFTSEQSAMFSSHLGLMMRELGYE